MARLTEDGRVYVRFQSPTPDDRGLHHGVFWLVNRLGRSGVLSEAEHARWRTGNAWFDAAYTTPDRSVYDAAANPGAVAWFKTASAHLVARTEEHCGLLRTHGVPYERVESADPGRVVYEDGDQVVVVPHG